MYCPPPIQGRLRSILASQGNVLAYWRTGEVAEATAWLLRDQHDPAKHAQRCNSARSVGRAVCAHAYRFADRFVAPLQLVTPTECAVCPLRGPCWGATAWSHCASKGGDGTTRSLQRRGGDAGAAEVGMAHEEALLVVVGRGAQGRLVVLSS